MSNEEQDWRAVSPEEMALIQSCGPDERCLMFEDQFVKLTKARLEAVLETAFKSAMAAACQLAGIGKGNQLASWDMDDIGLNASYLRVTVTDDQGRKTSAVGMIPDPRAH